MPGREKILDHGYVEHIESWGTGVAGKGARFTINPEGEFTHDHEAGIVEAARQSTQGSFRGWDQGDSKLLGFMYRHHHSTPFEFAGMVIEVQAPIFVFREWHRHRTQCLVGSTEIFLASPRGTTYKRQIKDIFDLKNGRPVGTGPHCTRNGYSKNGTPVTRRARWKDPQKVGALPNCQNRTLRVIDEKSGVSLTLPMKDIWESGVKEIFEVETSSGLLIQCSEAHPFLTRDGWGRLCDLSKGIETGRYAKIPTQERPIPPILRQGIGVWTSMMRTRLIRDCDVCYVCGREFPFDLLQLDHVEPVYTNLKRALDEENLRPICSGCHRLKTNQEQTGSRTQMGIRWDRIVRIERIGEEQTYDLEVNGPHHNFIANGLVVHNSYNEMSARYAPLPDLNYVPTTERMLMKQSGNKQAEGLAELKDYNVKDCLTSMAIVYSYAENTYQELLKKGVPKELARVVLPVGRYSRMRASANLRNWLAFLTLRLDQAAQWEIRQYAEAVGRVIAREFPHTWELFNEEFSK